MKLFLSCVLAALGASACMAQGPRAYPLYPNPEHPRSDGEVGVLDAPVAVIDGQEIADKGRTFALLPGCHSFRLVRSVGDVSMGSGFAYSAPLPQTTFTLEVQAAHFYAFDSVVAPFNGPDGSWSWGFSDHRRDGLVTIAHACDGAPLPALPNVK